MSDGETTHFDITGDVNLLHQMGRSWTTGVSYRRGADFRQTFALPTLSDSLSFSLRGEQLTEAIRGLSSQLSGSPMEAEEADGLSIPINEDD